MELYKTEAVELIRGTNSPLSLLPARTLAALWGSYSCTTKNCFWAPCVSAEVERFVIWASGRPAVTELIARARQKAFRIERPPAAKIEARPVAHFIRAWDNRFMADPLIRTKVFKGGKSKQPRSAKLMSVHELIAAVNQWCDDNNVHPNYPGCRPVVDVGMIRYCNRRSLLDAPGSPSAGRQRGFTEKHASQLRVIRLLQARSFSFQDISGFIHGRSLDQLHAIERDELNLSRGVWAAPLDSDLTPRTGQRRWA